MNLTCPLSNRFLHATQTSLMPGALAAALTASAVIPAGTFAFEATTTGTWTADDSGVPRLTLHIEHPCVTTMAFSFYGLVADEAVNTAGISIL